MSEKNKPSNIASQTYLNARSEWNERYGSYIKAAAQWRLIAVIALIVTAISVSAVAYIGSQSKFVPYVVAVDNLGASMAISRADRASAVDSKIVRASIARWIVNMRSVYTDAAAIRQANKDAYAFINRSGPALQQANEYFRANNPFERAKMELVTVEIQSVLPITDNTWRVEWIETTRNRNGTLTTQEHWQATVTTSIKPPTKEEEILINPLGIFIDSFSWVKRL